MNGKFCSRYLTILLFGIPLAQLSVVPQTNPFLPQDAVPASASSSQIPAGSPVEATLLKALDAKKDKVGEEVVAKVTKDFKVGDKVVIAKGSTIAGRLTAAKAKSDNNPESVLTISFDRALLKDGGEIALTVTIRALATPLDDRTVDSDATRFGGEAGVNGGIQGNDPASVLTSDSEICGVVGYRGLELQESSITSAVRNVHLNSRTQMVLQITGK